MYYDIDKIIHITKGEYESFTIPIIKHENDSILKNLVLHRKNNMPFDVKLLEYRLSPEQMARLREYKSVDLNNKVYIQQPINNQINSDSWSYWNDAGCLVTISLTLLPGGICACDEHNWGDSDANTCTCGGPTPPRLIIQVSYAFCSEGPIGGPSPPPPAPPPSTGPGGGYDPTQPPPPIPIAPPPSDDDVNNEIITTPIVPGFDQEVPPNPCSELKNLFDRAGFLARMQALNTPAQFNASTESGWAETITTNAVNVQMYEYKVGVASGPDDLDFPRFPYIGYSHVHRNNYTNDIGEPVIVMKIPSPADTEMFVENMQSGANLLGRSSKDTYGFTVTSEGTYCLKMLSNNPSPVNFTTIDFKEFKRKFTNACERLVEKQQATQANIEKLYLTYLKEFNLYEHVGLYKTTDPEFENWSRLKLRYDGELDNPDPC